ncbi:hypothetical protein H8356DRAFT_1379661 [Neocallimastix lanati (nom. inval.)]|uniref:Uncharacterized protein n=1 Tax=Neocallimastix californiae TaxID=1754190 RepID=A0A1Y2DU99_9FUNG|nr:hypothetical protein H8356DRAFT_1379661 [Neocallimastix sp. JGI-2020a]ORY62749.1 hypothetical protein LY90DRAFT_505320 [Neocallimastix californiae]|eukprot:ORY62749.1 hypothetical protein LY90DRAFT_505320 [Neocallimastix californiae]
MITEELNITSCEAGNVYNYTEKKETKMEKVLENSINNKLSTDEECLNKCKNDNADLKNTFKNYNITVLEEYSRKIYGSDIGCERLKEHEAEHVDVDEDYESKNESFDKVKRNDNECKPERKVEVMQYIDDIPKVRRIDNKTIISEVNGCGPKVERFLSVSKAENVFLDYIATKHNLEFEPACNAHDICYDCKVKKDECDNLMFKYPIEDLNLISYKEFFSINSMGYVSKEDIIRAINNMEYISWKRVSFLY